MALGGASAGGGRARCRGAGAGGARGRRDAGARGGRVAAIRQVWAPGCAAAPLIGIAETKILN